MWEEGDTAHKHTHSFTHSLTHSLKGSVPCKSRLCGRAGELQELPSASSPHRPHGRQAPPSPAGPRLSLCRSPSGPCTKRAAGWAGGEARSPCSVSWLCDLLCLNPGYKCGITCTSEAHGVFPSDHMLAVVARILVAKLFLEWHLTEY